MGLGYRQQHLLVHRLECRDGLEHARRAGVLVPRGVRHPERGKRGSVERGRDDGGGEGEIQKGGWKMIAGSSQIIGSSGGVRFELEDRGFSSALKDFYIQFGGDIAKIIRAQARLIAVNLTFQTQPFGASRPTADQVDGDQSSALERGQGKVLSDIKEVYTTPERIFYIIKETSLGAAKAFTKFMKTGQYILAQKLLDRLNIGPLKNMRAGPFDGGRVHKRVLRPIPARPRLKKNQKPELIVAEAETINTYAKEIGRRVGMAKAGWAHCAQQLGGTSGQTSTNIDGKQQVMIPKWVKRHMGNPSMGIVIDRSDAQPHGFVTMENMVPWIDKCLNQGQIQRALDIQRDKMERAIQKAEEYRSQKFREKYFGF